MISQWLGQVRFVQLFLFVLLSFGSFAVIAEDEEDAAGAASRYLAIEPAFVTNFGGPGRLRYMKVEVNLRVLGVQGEEQVMHHMPYIRDTLLSLFAVQEYATIGSATGKEELRQMALADVNRVIAEEDGESFVQDLLFTSFVAHQ